MPNPAVSGLTENMYVRKKDIFQCTFLLIKRGKNEIGYDIFPSKLSF
jgi:hypothetical protein